MRSIKRSGAFLVAILFVMSYTGKAFTAELTDEVTPHDVFNDSAVFGESEVSELEGTFDMDAASHTSDDVPETEDVSTETDGVSDTEDSAAETEGTSTETDGASGSFQDNELLNKIDIILPLTYQTQEAQSLSSPFDFSVDPCGLVEATHAIRYGGGFVEPGARVIFRNHDGKYDFSSRSDSLTVRNRSTFPIRITVTMRYDDTENVLLADLETLDKEFSFPVLCIAITDDAGQRVVLTQEGKATIARQLPPCEREEDSIECHFRLEGKCNPYADWRGVTIGSKLELTWSVEPILSENVTNAEQISMPQAAPP